MSSGVTVDQEVIERFKRDLKMSSTQKFNYMIFCFNDDRTKIVIDFEGTTDEELVKRATELRDDKRAFYLAYHQKCHAKEGTMESTKIRLFMFSDDNITRISERMLIASSAENFKKRLDGFPVISQIHSIDELLEDLELTHIKIDKQ